MKIIPHRNTQRIIIDPGEYHVSRQPEIISTLLGSCVACCLYDPAHRVFGMNHFLLAHQHPAPDQNLLTSEEGRYGIYAMELLINAMMKQGANRYQLKAKCFGGSDVLQAAKQPGQITVGQANVEFIEAFLESERIPMVSACLGGRQGLNIHFLGSDYSVMVKKIGAHTLSTVKRQERDFWQKRLQAEQTSANTLETW